MPEPSADSLDETPQVTSDRKSVGSKSLMMRTTRYILWLLVVVTLLVVIRTGPDKKADQNELVATRKLVIEQPGVELVPRPVNDFSLIERSGKPVTKKDLLGKPWVVNFIFTSCAMSCPANTKAMMELSHACKDLDVRFVTISVDPERDTPERLTQYAEVYQADPEQWLFLTGDKDKIFDLIRYSFLQIIEEKKGKDRLFGYEFAHTDRVMHIDSQGVVAGQYLSTDPKEMAILKRVLAGKMEAPEENLFLVPKDLPQTAPDKNESPAEPSQEKKSPQSQPAKLVDVPVRAEDSQVAVPDWLTRLPAINALLNGCATLLLMFGYMLIRAGKRDAHKKVMLTAFATSVVFLGFYLLYHFGLRHYTGESSKKFPDIGMIRQIYLSILFSHIILAITVPFLAIRTIYLGLAGKWEKHRTMAQVTFPIWLYVSITGVIIYVLLYQVAGA